MFQLTVLREVYMGYFHLMIMELNIITLFQRKMLFCSEWLDHGFPYSSQYVYMLIPV